MANDFDHNLKRNLKIWRSSCSQITNQIPNTTQTTSNKYSVSFNAHLHSISRLVSDSTDTPVCSDNEYSDDEDDDLCNAELKQWYMPFPDETTSGNCNSIGIAQSAPNMDCDIAKPSDGAKTVYAIHIHRDLHQLYSEGAGGFATESIANGGEGMTMMGYLYSEGRITMDVDDEDVQQKGITLMGMYSEVDEDALIHKQALNITLMGYCEGCSLN
eukprot:419265_1